MEEAINEIELTYTPAQLEMFFEDPDVKYKIIRKGRRAGATQGAEKAFIEWALEGISPMLWVDTINGNIERYYERYFLPDLKQLTKYNIPWSYNAMKKVLKIANSVIDFRSADTPESIEGFGYRKIFLNEAGIILKDDYLYSHAILPMLLDYPDSQLIAAGVPKGMIKKDGGKHKFFELFEKAESGRLGYKDYRYTSYQNPLLDERDIDDMVNEMTEAEAMQEIFGMFVDFDGKNPFAHKYDPAKHESVTAQYNQNRQLIIHMDFNLNPFAILFSHIWQDALGYHDHQFDEFEIPNGNIPELVERINKKYYLSLQGCLITGDSMGKRGDMSQRDNASLYVQLVRGLGMSESQLKVPPNPTHENSRTDTNYILQYFPDFKINPVTCPNTCRDMKTVQCDAYGKILKRDRSDLSQRADFLDGLRSKIHAFHRPWIQNHQRLAQMRFQANGHSNGNGKLVTTAK